MGPIPSDWCDHAPDAARAVALARAWRGFWLQQAREALDAAEGGLGRTLDEHRDRLSRHDLDARLHPRAAARVADAYEAMAAGDGARVRDALQAWLQGADEDWTAPRLEVSSVASEDWERAFVASVRGTRIEGAKALQFLPLLGKPPARLVAAIEEALDLVGRVDPDMRAELDQFVAAVKLFDGEGVEGLSSPRAFGAVWIRVPRGIEPVRWFLEHLVHECSHLHMNALMAFDPLLANPLELDQAPLRPDPRPLFQILHATHVLGRNLRVHGRLVRQAGRRDLAPDLARFEEQHARGMAVLLRRGRFTSAGDHWRRGCARDGLLQAG